jgi:hypothetical protein
MLRTQDFAQFTLNTRLFLDIIPQLKNLDRPLITRFFIEIVLIMVMRGKSIPDASIFILTILKPLQQRPHAQCKGDFYQKVYFLLHSIYTFECGKPHFSRDI